MERRESSLCRMSTKLDLWALLYTCAQQGSGGTSDLGKDILGSISLITPTKTVPIRSICLS